MEEILASIRRIIADDETTKPAEASARPEPVPTPPAPESPRVRAPEPARAVPPPMPRPVAAEPVMQRDAMLADEGRAMPVPSADVDVLDLTEDMALSPATPAFRTVDAGGDIEFADTGQVTSEPPAAPVQPRPLMSASTMAAVDSAFNSLAHTVLAGNARTLEDLVREMLRPLLKSWIDDNLPGLVERIVRAEVERVSRGR
jgi:uncharacterized protein